MTSARKYPRTARLNEAVLEVLADELERMSDPRLELVTFTGVDVTRDLSYATVFYSTLGATTAGASETFAEDAATALASAGAHFRGVLGRQLRIRQVPVLRFSVDAGIMTGQRIEEILREIHHADSKKEEAGGEAGGGEDS
jgi:ribosome-binding factor A